MRTKINLNDYKRFKCDVKLQTLIDFVANHEPNVSTVDWRLVRKSHQNLCRSILRLHQKHTISDAYLQTAQQVLEPVSAWLQQHAKVRFQPDLQPDAFNFKAAGALNIVYNKNTIPDPLNSLLKADQKAPISLQPSNSAPLLDAIQLIKTTDPSAVLGQLKQIKLLAQTAWKERQDLALYISLKEMVKDLKLDVNFWQQAINGDPKKAEALIVELGAIADLFNKSCFMLPEAQIEHPEKVYVFAKLLQIQEWLCKQGHGNSAWKHLALQLDKRTVSFDNKMFCCLADAQMHRELQQITAVDTPQGYRLDAPPSAVVQLNLETILPQLRSFAADCQAANCFKVVASSSVRAPSEGLANLLNSSHTVDPIKRNELKHLTNDLAAYNAQKPTLKYTLDA